MSQMTVDQAMQIAVQHHQAGRIGQAELICRQVLQHAPSHVDALFLLSVVADQAGQPDAAVDLIRRALAVFPEHPVYLCHLGIYLAAQGQMDSAIAAYQQAISIDPNTAEAWFNLGNADLQRGDRARAIESYQRAIAIRPTYAKAYNNLGIVLNDEDHLDEAVIALGKAIELMPTSADAYNNLGNAWNKKKQYADAITCYSQAIRLDPKNAGAHMNLGVALARQGAFDQAVASLHAAIKLDPNRAMAHYQLGKSLAKLQRIDEAILALERAMELQPGYPQGEYALAMARLSRGELSPGLAGLRRAVTAEPEFREAFENLLYVSTFDPAATPQSLLDLGRQWDRQFGQPLQGDIRPHANNRDSNRRLRIGYLSPDFRDHPVGRFMRSLISQHNREQFEITCYAHEVQSDEETETIKAVAGNWRDITHLSDDQTAAAVREDAIDILIDLSVHTGDNRLPVLARKPAPVQVTFAGYPGSTYLSAIDYRLTDSHLDPPGLFDAFYSEQSVRLPTFWCDHLMPDQPAVNDLPAPTSGLVTFACLNVFHKSNEPTWAMWAETMRLIRNSRLLMLAPPGSPRQRVTAFFVARGIKSHRVEFLDRQNRANYLRLYERIDLCLDTWPYNGHSTSFDSLWMGVPVITLVGPTVVGRGGYSLLSNLDLQELAADTPEQFARIAADLAKDLPRLAELRRGLRDRMRRSPLTDASRFAREVEKAYRWMFRTWADRPDTIA